jgi:hypothetical protein
MRSHNYKQHLQASLPSAQDLAELVPWNNVRFPAARAAMTSPESRGSPLSAAGSPSARSDIQASLLAALRGQRLRASSPVVTHDEELLQLWRLRAGLAEDADLPFEDRLQQLEVVSQDWVEQYSYLVDRAITRTDAALCPHKTALSISQLMWEQGWRVVEEIDPSLAEEWGELRPWPALMDCLRHLSERLREQQRPSLASLLRISGPEAQ